MRWRERVSCCSSPPSGALLASFVGTLLAATLFYSPPRTPLWSPVNLLVSAHLSVGPALVSTYVPSFQPSPCLALTSVFPVCSSSFRPLIATSGESLCPAHLACAPSASNLTLTFPALASFPVKRPSADSSSAHTTWVAAAGPALIPAKDYCNVLGQSPVMLK